MPFVAATWAIPLPMAPAPITPIVLTDIERALLSVMCLAGAAWRKPNSLADVTANVRLSRQYGRECNEGGDVIDRTCCQGDHK